MNTAKKDNIICFANDWHGDPTSKHQVMKVLSRDRKVLWINSVSMRTPKFNKSDFSRVLLKIKSFSQGIELVSENFFVFTPLILPFPGNAFVRRVNYYILLLSIKYYVKKLRLYPYHIWTFIPTMVNLIGHLKESKVVYYCVDEWSKFSFLDGTLMQKLERELLQKSDIVITTATTLYADKQQYAANCLLVPHGVDWSHFSQALTVDRALPNDMRSLKKPVIGFFGLIHDWIDLDLIVFLATKRPMWSFVLIGKSSVDMSGVAQFRNIHLFGQMPYAQLPDYCRAMDVALIPFKLNDLTIHVNPIKLREYLAAGLPVVSTNLPEVAQYSHLVEIGKTNDEFLEKIEKCLQENSDVHRQARSAAMMKETWEVKVETIMASVNQ